MTETTRREDRYAYMPLVLWFALLLVAIIILGLAGAPSAFIAITALVGVVMMLIAYVLWRTILLPLEDGE